MGLYLWLWLRGHLQQPDLHHFFHPLKAHEAGS